MAEGFVTAEQKGWDLSTRTPNRGKKDFVTSMTASVPAGFSGRDTGKATRLGRLSILPAKTDIIVLDGQHRANAFRYVAGAFQPKDWYKPFYAKVQPLKDYVSDLPVTIVWFDCEEGEVRAH